MARERKVACPKCGATYWGERNLARHTEKRHHQCPFCPLSFIRLQMHIAKAHPDAILEGPGASPADSEG